MDLNKILPKDGPPIDQVKKYIEKYKNDLIVIKYGGNVFIDRNIFNNFIEDISI
jgi:Acetylglutamate kinase